jgi:hypothetical protein
LILILPALSESGRYGVRVLTRNLDSKRAQDQASLPNVSHIRGTQDNQADLTLRSKESMVHGLISMGSLLANEMNSSMESAPTKLPTMRRCSTIFGLIVTIPSRKGVGMRPFIGATMMQKVELEVRVRVWSFSDALPHDRSDPLPWSRRDEVFSLHCRPIYGHAL